MKGKPSYSVYILICIPLFIFTSSFIFLFLRDGILYLLATVILMGIIGLFSFLYLYFYTVEINNEYIIVKKFYQSSPTIIRLSSIKYYGKPRENSRIIDGPYVVEISDGINNVKINLKIFSFEFAGHLNGIINDVINKKTLV